LEEKTRKRSWQSVDKLFAVMASCSSATLARTSQTNKAINLLVQRQRAERDEAHIHHSFEFRLSSILFHRLDDELQACEWRMVQNANMLIPVSLARRRSSASIDRIDSDTDSNRSLLGENRLKTCMTTKATKTLTLAEVLALVHGAQRGRNSLQQIHLLLLPESNINNAPRQTKQIQAVQPTNTKLQAARRHALQHQAVYLEQLIVLQRKHLMRRPAL
jgi:hypothetical protein